jgi:glycine oxidase
MKVVIVGAGIAGLAIAWRLSQAGAIVEIVERGIVGRGATWAAAGMLAPGAELEAEPEPIAALARRSRQAWPQFAFDLESESGCGIGYSEPGSLLIAVDQDRAHELQQRVVRLAASGTLVEWIDPADLRRREPLLSTEIYGALHIAGDAQVDTRRISHALRVALERRNVTIRENTEVRGLHVEAVGVRGVLCAGATIEADAVLVASGAWMNMLGRSEAALPPVYPVKGQMVSVEPPEKTVLPQSLLWSEDVYLVSRSDRTLIGATVEDAGFDTSVSREAGVRLVSAASRLIPSISQWRVTETWASLRPRTPDGAPVLGATAIRGLYVAGGQFRNGILFAPAMADAMRNMVLNGSSHDFMAFDPRRFDTS